MAARFATALFLATLAGMTAAEAEMLPGSEWEPVTLGAEAFEPQAEIFLRFEADGASLRFTFENLPNLALWQKPGAPYLCIEPWHGMAARAGASPQMTERPGTLELAPGRSAEFSFTVTFPA